MFLGMITVGSDHGAILGHEAVPRNPLVIALHPLRAVGHPLLRLTAVKDSDLMARRYEQLHGMLADEPRWTTLARSQNCMRPVS
jgi:hypothetical protein